MNRIDSLFAEKQDILSIYFTAGFPALGDTMSVLKALEDAGVDMVEIGMPFSDPLADGPVIQLASLQALNNGMKIKVLLEQIRDMRKTIKMPVCLMGYINPVMHYGLEKFLGDCKNCGVDALILPDLPWDEYVAHYKALFDSYGIYLVPLIAPQIYDERIKKIDENAQGFIYEVASAGITGNIKTSEDYRTKYFERVRSLGLKNKLVVGFGIKDKESFEHACKHADGAIIGTRFINHLKENGTDAAKIAAFVKSVR